MVWSFVADLFGFLTGGSRSLNNCFGRVFIISWPDFHDLLVIVGGVFWIFD